MFLSFLIFFRCKETGAFVAREHQIPVLVGAYPEQAENEDTRLETEELGIFQVLERLEEVTNILISR
jgi:hypothetical protein